METMSGETRKKPGVKRPLLPLAVLAITAILLCLLASIVDVGAVARKLLSIDARYVLGFLLLETGIFLVSARRYQAILRFVGCKLPFRRCFTVNMATYPFISILPSVSGNLVKIIYLADESPPGKVISSVLAERLFDFGVVGLLAVAGLTFYLGFPVILVTAALVLALAVLTRLEIAGHLPDRGLLGRIGRILADIVDILRDGKTTAILSFYTLLMWALALVQISLFFAATGAEVPLQSVFLRMPIAMLIGQIPVTMSGMGTRDGAMLYLFAGLATAEQILAIGFLFTIFRYWVPAVAGLAFMIAENRRMLALQKS